MKSSVEKWPKWWFYYLGCETSSLKMGSVCLLFRCCCCCFLGGRGVELQCLCWLLPCLQNHLHSPQLKTQEKEEGSVNDLYFLYWTCGNWFYPVGIVLFWHENRQWQQTLRFRVSQLCKGVCKNKNKFWNEFCQERNLSGTGSLSFFW